MLKEYCSLHAIDYEVKEFLKAFDHHSDFFRNNFFNIVQTIASVAPVLHSECYGGFTVVSGYNQIRDVTMNTTTYINESRSRVIPSAPLPPLIPTDLNGQDHIYWRSALNPLFLLLG
jgi:cytochrome P450